jgi:hypothetical protein
VRDEERNKLEQMASLENRSLSNLIEVMADERWERLAEQQGVAKGEGTLSKPSWHPKRFQENRSRLGLENLCE